MGMPFDRFYLRNGGRVRGEGRFVGYRGYKVDLQAFSVA